MDEFIEKLETFLKKNQVSKKRTLGNIPTIDNNGNYLIEKKEKISKLIKPKFIKDKNRHKASENIDYLRNKLLNQYFVLQNSYYSDYPLEDIKSDQQKLKENIKLIDSFKSEEHNFEKELSEITKQIILFEKKLIKLYYTINFGEKDQIKKYLELKMKLEDLRKKEKLLKERGVKRVTIQDFKISDLENLKIEYLNIKKTVLSTNKKEIISSKKTMSKSVGSLKKTQKKLMKGGFHKNSILKKKGSMKNTKSISWESSLPDGTQIIDNSYNDFSDLENTTNIDLSSISGNMDESETDIDLSNLNIIDNNDNFQQGGGLENSLKSLNIDSLTESSEKNVIVNDLPVNDLSQQDTDILIQNGDVRDTSDLINLENKKSMGENFLEKPELGLFSSNCASIHNLSSMSLENDVNDKSSPCYSNTLNENVSPVKFNLLHESQILEDSSKLTGGGDKAEINSKPIVENNWSVTEKSSDDSLDMDKIMVSINDNNDLNIISEPLDTLNESINNSDIKIINLK